MAITRKKNKTEKTQKRVRKSGKAISRPKTKDEVCVMEDIVMAEPLSCCEDIFCCLA